MKTCNTSYFMYRGKNLIILLSTIFALSSSLGLFAQTTVFSDDFNRSVVTPGGLPTMNYTLINNSNTGSPILESTVATGTVPYLKIIGYLSSGATAGQSYLTGPLSSFLSPFNSTLSSNPGLVTWSVNVRQNYNGAIGSLAGRFVGVVLAASEANLISPTCSGYAIVQGNTTTSGYQLVKFGAGLGTTGTITTIGSVSTTAGVRDYLSVKVTYNPTTNMWSLYQRTEVGAVFTDPSTVTTQIGTSTFDNTYTGTPLQVFGYFTNHPVSTVAFNIYFDNFKVTVDATTAPSTQVTNIAFSNIATTSLTASWTNGNSAKRIIILNTSNNFTNPVDGVEPTFNTVYAGSGEQIVYNGTGNSVSITGLSPNTTYWLRAYEYSYGPSLYPYYQTSTVTDNPKSLITLGASLAPSIINPTVSGIANNTAVLGGEITSDGGAPITERGTVWKVSSGVTIADNMLAEGGTTTGVFTHSRMSLPPKTLIYYAAYATNGIGTTLSPESSFYTRADQPISNVGSFTATPILASSTGLNLSWTPATGADGYLIVQKPGSAAAGTAPSDATAYAPGSILGTGTIAAIVLPGTSTSQDITGLASGTLYTFRIYPFGYDGLNAQTLNYYTASPFTDASGTTNIGTNLTDQYSKIKFAVNNGIVFITGAKDQNVKVSLLTGQLVKNMIIKSDSESFSLNNGFYIIAVGQQRYKIQLNSK